MDILRTLTERLTALREERARFVEQANQQVAAYNGAEAELQRLITQLQATEAEPSAET